MENRRRPKSVWLRKGCLWIICYQKMNKQKRGREFSIILCPKLNVGELAFSSLGLNDYHHWPRFYMAFGWVMLQHLLTEENISCSGRNQRERGKWVAFLAIGWELHGQTSKWVQVDIPQFSCSCVARLRRRYSNLVQLNTKRHAIRCSGTIPE